MKSKFTVYIFLSALFCSNIFFATQCFSSEDARTYEKKAQAAYDRQDYIQSYIHYSNLLKVHTKNLGINATETLRARRKAAESLAAQGKNKEANILLEQLRKDQEKALGKEHRETLKTKYIQAITHYNLGELQAMLDTLDQLFPVQERTLGPDARDTLETLSVTGSGLFAIGKTQDAKEIWEKVLNLSMKRYGNNDALTLFTQMTLGVAISALGNPQKALDIYLKILPSMQKVVGPEHWKTSNLYLNISIAYRKLGDNIKAQEYDDKIAYIQEKVFSEDHPQRLSSRRDSARKLFEEGKFQEAKIELEEILQRQKEVIGESHINTFTTALLLAQNYRQLGELDNASKLLENYIPLSEKSLGNEHILTHHFLYEQAMLLRVKGELKKAHTILKKLMLTHEQVFGKDHRDALNIKEDIIILEAQLGKDDNTEQKLKENLALMEKKFGENHPHTITAINNYVTFLNKEEKFQDAIILQEKIYNSQKEKLGSEHPDTLLIAVNLADLYANAGDKKSAKEIYEKVIPLLEKNLGNNHLDTINAKNSLSTILNSKESLESIKLLYAATKKTFGINHPTTLVVLHNLATSYTQFYDYESAKKLLEEGINSASKTLGKDSEIVSTLRSTLASVYSLLNKNDAALKIYNELLDSYSIKYGNDSHKVSILNKKKAELLTDMGIAPAENTFHAKTNINQNHISKYSDKSIKELLHLYHNYAKNNKHNEIEKITTEILSRYMAFNSPYEGISPTLFMMLSAGALTQNKFNSAAFFSKISVLLERGQRSDITGLDRDLQQLVQGVTQTKYHSAMMVLMKQQRYAEAFSTLYFLKEAELDDKSRTKLLEKNYEKEFLLAMEEELYKEHNAFAEKFYALGKKFIPLDSRLHSLSPTEMREHAKLSTKMENMRQEYINFLLTMEEKLSQKAQKKALDDEFRAAKTLMETPQPTNEQERKVFLKNRELAAKKFAYVMAMSEFLLNKSASDLSKMASSFRVKPLQEQLANFKDGVFVHTALMPDHLVIFLTSQKHFIPYAINVPSSKINDLVIEFRNSIANPASDPRPIAEKIYNLIIKPIREKIDSLGATTLIFSLDGNLRYIPMGALFDGKQWLVENYDIILFNEATQSFNSPQQGATKHIAAMGVTLQSQGFSALPSVQYEIDSIVKDGNYGVLTGKKYLNDKFTNKALARSLKMGTPLIHIASHFQFDPVEQQNSFLLIGNDHKITMKEMFSDNNQYSFKDVDLLALSACDTASGLKNGDGREIESFGALAQKQGAKAVLATLWSVADTSTAAFMQNFYTKYAHNSLTKGKALALTQRMFINGQITAQNTRYKIAERGKMIAPKSPAVKKYTWSHPYFWAPFILMGGGK